MKKMSEHSHTLDRIKFSITVLLCGLAVMIVLTTCEDPFTNPVLDEVKQRVEEKGEGDTYSVVYHANEADSGNVPVDEKRYAAGAVVTILANTGGLEKSGATFTGWNTQADGAGVSYSPGQNISMGNGDLDLYAEWTTVITYSVTYLPNGATGGDVPSVCNHKAGDAVTVSSNTGGLNRTAYDFAGWNTQADGLGSNYAAGSGQFTMPAYNISLYAKWTGTITFDANGGYGSMSTQTIIAGQSAGLLNNGFAKPGHIFNGWDTEPDGTGTDYVAGVGYLMDTGHETLYAQWTLDMEKILASDGAADDYFGYSVAISEDYAIVGAQNDDEKGTNSGCAYVFHRTGPNSWDLSTKLTVYDGDDSDQFGYSVAISSDYAIVGAFRDDDNGTDSGSAYIFRRIGTTSWSFGTKITASDGGPDDGFGQSVAINGDYVIVGAPRSDGAASGSGSAYIFHRTDLYSWDEEEKLFATDGTESDKFGLSVAIEGEYAIFGAHGDDDTGSDSGSAYIFQRTGISSWDTGTKLTAEDGSPDDWFGTSVAINGDYAIIGSYKDDDQGDSSGSAYIYHRTGSNSWGEWSKITASDGDVSDCFSSSVAITQDFAIVGAWGDDEVDQYAGAIYVFRRTGTNSWDEATKIRAPDGSRNDLLGGCVAVSDDFAIVGAHNDDDNGSNSGSAYIIGSILP